MTLSAAAGRANRRKGLDAERAVARYLRAHGFPNAERAVRTGYTTPEHTSPDPGDLTGITGTVWSIKHDASNRITQWLTELDEMRHTHEVLAAFLVVRRTGKADPGRWWTWTTLGTISHLTGTPQLPNPQGPICLELVDLVPLLNRGGYKHHQESP